MTHAEYSKKQSLSSPCDRPHMTFGGRCLNCGYEPKVKTWTVAFGQSKNVYYTDYHAEQFMRALTLNGTPHTLTVT